MPSSVTSLLNKIKSSCDPETLMFVFNGEKEALAFNRTILFSIWESRIPSKTDALEHFEGISFKNMKIPKQFDEISKGVYYDETSMYVYKWKPTYVSRDEQGIVTQYEGVWYKTNYIAEKKSVKNSYGVTETYFGYKDDENTYYRQQVIKRAVRNPNYSTYYKNSNGVWCDYNLLMTAFFATTELDKAATMWEETVKIPDISILPKCKFIDSEGYIHYIDAADGIENDESVISIDLDTNSSEVVSYEPYSLKDPTLPFSARHIMMDLKVQIPENYKKNQFLVWLNGAFVPTVKDANYDNIFFIENAMTMIGSKVINQSLGAAHKMGENATVIENVENDEYRYDANLRFFGWKGIHVSDFFKPIRSEQIPVTYNFESVYPIQKIEFAEEINKDAHVIICNGKILPPDDYDIDNSNPRLVILKKVESEAYSLLNEIVRDINENVSYYDHVNPLRLISHIIANKNYSLVNFYSDDPEKKAKLVISKSCSVNFPYKNEVTFPKLNIGDMILLRGMYNEYLWEHQNTIKFVKNKWTFADGIVDKFTEEDVLRYHFILS